MAFTDVGKPSTSYTGISDPSTSFTDIGDPSTAFTDLTGAYCWNIWARRRMMILLFGFDIPSGLDLTDEYDRYRYITMGFYPGVDESCFADVEIPALTYGSGTYGAGLYGGWAEVADP